MQPRSHLRGKVLSLYIEPCFLQNLTTGLKHLVKLMVRMTIQMVTQCNGSISDSTKTQDMSDILVKYLYDDNQI